MKNFLLFHMETILNQYAGDIPLAHFLKQYFKNNPRLGSRDRKSLTEGAYVYYRIVQFIPHNKEKLEILLQGLKVCNSTNNFLFDSFQKSGVGVLNTYPASIENWKYYEQLQTELSKGINLNAWLQSLLIQPDLFIRLRKNNSDNQEKLKNSGYLKPFDSGLDVQLPNCYRLENSSKIDSVLPSEDYIVQDWASQTSMQVFLNFIQSQTLFDSKQTIWDVCAGAGGKSLYWKDARPQDFLVVTDIRQSILKNLKQRFSTYGIQRFKTMILDAENKRDIQQKIAQQSFLSIICDVPCTGSGTWARTPEQLSFFDIQTINSYAERQFQIAFESQKYLKQSGVFAYITCSIFQEENEKVVEKLIQKTPLQLISQKLINGISKNADSLFIALFTK